VLGLADQLAQANAQLVEAREQVAHLQALEAARLGCALQGPRAYADHANRCVALVQAARAAAMHSSTPTRPEYAQALGRLHAGLQQLLGAELLASLGDVLDDVARDLRRQAP